MSLELCLINIMDKGGSIEISTNGAAVHKKGCTEKTGF